MVVTEGRESRAGELWHTFLNFIHNELLCVAGDGMQGLP